MQMNEDIQTFIQKKNTNEKILKTIIAQKFKNPESVANETDIQKLLRDYTNSFQSLKGVADASNKRVVKEMRDFALESLKKAENTGSVKQYFTLSEMDKMINKADKVDLLIDEYKKCTKELSYL